MNTHKEWKINELVTKTNKVQFRYYSHKELWYEVVAPVDLATCPENWAATSLNPPFLFPVPIEDTGDGKFMAEDKSLLFMRYIRQYLEKIKAEQQHAEQISK